jgi:hypothetical protein
MPPFLSDLELRKITLPAGSPFQPVGLALGNGSPQLEVLVATSAAKPRGPAVRELWQARNNGRAAPLLVVVLHDGRATLCGPAGDQPPVYEAPDVSQVERLCREALQQPDRHAALRLLRDTLPSVETRLPGIRNEGFLATHELTSGIRGSEQWRAVWQTVSDKARRVVDQSGESLLRGLGFTLEACDGVTSILRTTGSGKKVAVAILLHQSESPESGATRFSGLSPLSYALAVADRENLPYVLVQQGSKLRLYPVKVGVGVGRRGRTETYIEIHTWLLRDADAAYLWLIFSAEALVEGGSLEQLLEESRRFAGSLAENLRERIYNEVLPRLAEGLAAARGLKKPAASDLAETYEMTMTVLFRLLFIAYAEDKDLLPYRWNQLYRDRSLKRKAEHLLELHRQGTAFDTGDSLWEEVSRLFRAVDEGQREWGVPAYDGGLFSRDPEVSHVGALLAGVKLPNTIMGPVLLHLLLIGTPEGLGAVDFRSLGVREFGTIYEGLLESELAVAETDLTTDEKGFYRPCRQGEEPKVQRQHIYLHNRSGARKSTGTYFTKPFAVEYLLNQALEPALEEHLARLDALADEEEAGAAFFDFRVADIAMGSGHFLVAAVDRIERALSQYLSKRPLALASLHQELATLRASAVEALGKLAEQIGDQIEDMQLLRRLIARRCIYGVDLNPVAVHLARLSIWIHTFVPGLPLSLLDHNLVLGNSLVGIGRINEIEEKANEENTDPDEPEQRLMFPINAQQLIGEATEPLDRLAQLLDATAAQVRQARQTIREARKAVLPAEALCDVVTACRMAGQELPRDWDLHDWNSSKTQIAGSKPHQDAQEALKHLHPLHFPIAFPDVFLRRRSGFDVILGNPPWEKTQVEEHGFWARHEPGFRGLTQREQEKVRASLSQKRPDLVAQFEVEVAEAEAMRHALMTGPYPGMGQGHPDLYKAFCWRFWQLIGEGSWIGVLLPRSALSAKGSTEFRAEVFQNACPVDVTMLVNNRQWVFSEVHPQYSIGLVAICRAPPAGKPIRLRGPFASLERFTAGSTHPPAEFTGEEVRSWTDAASLPLLPTEESLAVFVQLRKSPRFDLNDGASWRARPIQGDLNATADKELMDLKSEDCPRGFWPVFKGESFDIWDPDTGRYYAWADPKEVLPVLQESRLRSSRNRKSAFFEYPNSWVRDPKTLPCNHARIAFRDVSRATDSRTVRVALIPPKVILNHKAPYFLWPQGDERDAAYLLGVLASLPLDWYARRFVETSLTFFILNPFPIPRPPRTSPLWQRAVALAGRLASVDDRYERWAKAVGVGCGPLEAAEKDGHIRELDAVVAHLYRLQERHLVHIFETFHVGWDYKDRLAATLKHYRAWQGATVEALT